jgi:Cu/Ag efflux protein CusF
MKKAVVFSVISLLSLAMPAHSASQDRALRGTGEVITVDPVYSQVTIRHGAIKDYAGDATTEFYVTDASLLKNVQKGDLVDFSLKDEKGDVRIDKITKTGVAVFPATGSPLGETVQGVLHGTGEIVKSVTHPLPVAGEVGQALGDTTAATGDALRDVPTVGKTKF